MAGLNLYKVLKERFFILLLAILVMLVTPLWWLRFAWAVLTSPTRAWRLLVAQDQAANAALNGSEDETVSSRAGRARDERRRWGCILCKLLDAIDPGHCDKSVGT